MYSVINLLLIKTAGTPRLPQLTPQMPTYPSSGKIGGEIIKLYQSRCFHIKKTAVDTLGFLFYKVAHCLYFTLGGENLAVFGNTLSGFYLLLHVIFAP